MEYKTNLFWCLEEAEKALLDDDPQLAARYVAKALEQLRCKICHQELAPDQGEPHYKGRVHSKCRERYGGRVAYLREEASDG